MAGKDESKCGLVLPREKEIIETATTYLWFEEDGILCALAKTAPRDEENVTETLDALYRMTAGKRVCMLCDTNKIGYYSVERREQLSTAVFDIFRAVALVPCNRMGKLLGAFFFMRKKKKLPVKLFDDVEEAKVWLRSFL